MSIKNAHGSSAQSFVELGPIVQTSTYLPGDGKACTEFVLMPYDIEYANRKSTYYTHLDRDGNTY